MLPEEMETYPPIVQAYFCTSTGTHIRSGGHDITAVDWKFYLDYMDCYFVKEDTNG